MYSIVHVDPKKEYGVARLPEWKAVQDGLKRNLITFLQHYRHASYSVAADHLLVKLLQSMNVPITLNSDRYYSNISLNALNVANSLQLTTPFGEGQLFKGVFFNKQVQEVIIAFDELFDYEKIETNWQDATPVRVIQHPFPHVTLQVPNGKFVSPHQGVAVVAVNVSLLAVQHRAFLLAEQRKQTANPDYVQRNTMQFIHMFVLPNMLESYLDYAVFNRINHLFNDEPMLMIPTKSAVHLPNYTRPVDNALKRLLTILDRSDYSPQAVLAAIPAVSFPDMRQVMLVPDVAPTRQILWSVILARLPMLLFLARIAKKTGRIRNQAGLADVSTMLIRLKNQRVLDSTLPKTLYTPAMDSINEILGYL
jgi:hypothetical protein